MTENDRQQPDPTRLTMLVTPPPAADVLPARIGRYEILGLLGAGGMGRVYRARDTQLERTVAVKVLPAAFAADHDYLRRFEQEARATAALNHPGIMAIHDAGVYDGMPYLVSELLEGQTLRARLEAGPVPIEQVLDFAIQVAESLAAAHAKGIVHRDLKPENLFVCAGNRIKVLDFGLARLVAPAGQGPGLIDVTGNVGGTAARTILGTPGYMAPEQARGELADHRADIFAFGCILYEMLEGRRAFDGRTPADVLSSILKDSPAHVTSSVERPLPPVLDRVVQRCLMKEPGSRFQSASDLAFALQSVPGSSPAPEPAVTAPKRARPAMRFAAVAAAAVAAALIGFAGGYTRKPTDVPLVAEFLVPPPADDELFASMPLPGLLPTAPQAGLSPDGTRLAFVTSDPTGKRRLWIRSIASARPRVVEGTEGANSWPFWSPDSRQVVVAVGRTLLKVDTATDTVERLTTLPEQAPQVPFVTGAWSADGTVLFSTGGSNPLYRTTSSGGSVQPVTRLDPGRGDQYHSWPQLLPGGRFLFFVRTDNAETNGVYAGTLGSLTSTLVHANASRAVYADGHLLWAVEDRVVAQPFDASGLRLAGQPATIVPSVFQGAGRTPGFWASSAGSLVYAAGDTRERQFRSFARDGTPIGPVGPPGLYVTFDVSADLSKVVAEVSKNSEARFATLALFDAARGILSPLTLGDQHDSDPRFGPGDEIVFARNSGNTAGITHIDPVSGRSSTLVPRGAMPVIWMEDWALDASSVVYRTAANRDAWQQHRDSAAPRRLTDASEPIEQVQLSPDQQWIVYNTAETGRSEVFIAAVAPLGERRQVSTAGGVQATWRADGRELYYLDLDGALYAVDIALAPTLTIGRPRLLFRTDLPVISAVVEQYRPSADGQRFLFCLPLSSVRREPLRMLLNWPAQMTR